MGGGGGGAGCGEGGWNLGMAPGSIRTWMGIPGTRTAGGMTRLVPLAGRLLTTIETQSCERGTGCRTGGTSGAGWIAGAKDDGRSS